ncbi:hypothetical protein AB2L27_14585 [Kineococcus sp. LSe6-4]|uniref:Uncharacterized protein n=1 Tax=Kineococcus halophytocola TaxID=3234027 RepID=A0ABV4H3W4_9ACTN
MTNPGGTHEDVLNGTSPVLSDTERAVLGDVTVTQVRGRHVPAGRSRLPVPPPLAGS